MAGPGEREAYKKCLRIERVPVHADGMEDGVTQVEVAVLVRKIMGLRIREVPVVLTVIKRCRCIIISLPSPSLAGGTLALEDGSATTYSSGDIMIGSGSPLGTSSSSSCYTIHQRPQLIYKRNICCCSIVMRLGPSPVIVPHQPLICPSMSSISAGNSHLIWPNRVLLSFSRSVRAPTVSIARSSKPLA